MGRSLGLAVGIVALVVLLGVQPAGAAWSPQSVTQKQGPSGNLSAVSCPTSSSCMAVGYYVDPTGRQQLFTEAWGGSSWARKVVSPPSGAVQSRLTGVSCTAATECTAVGSYGTYEGDQKPLIKRWDGSSWTTQAAPVPPGTTLAYLEGVSCTTATSCTAVGAYGTSSVKSATFFARWNGTSWTRKASPNPSGAVRSQLHGVSCSGTTCIAVGDFSQADTAPNQLFAQRFNGTSWAVQPIAVPDGTQGANLRSVSCTSATACTAVGGYATQSSRAAEPDNPLIARWDGSSWTQQPAAPPNTYVFGYTALGSVSCASATSCTAVGAKPYAGTGMAPLVQHWDGTSWSVQYASTPAGSIDAWLYGVSCLTSGCTAVGGSTTSLGRTLDAPSATLAERRTEAGTAWQIQRTVDAVGAGDGALNDVSCVSATWCAAVGTWFGGKSATVLAQRWNGTSWAIQSGAPVDSGNAALSGVSCSAANACTAVGEATVRNRRQPLAHRWNGSSWTAQTVPTSTESFDNLFFAVACPSATFCIAVGRQQRASYPYEQLPLVEVWDGSAWSIVSSPVPAGSVFAQLKDVACTSASACMAVGASSTTNQSQATPLALRWNGSSLTIESVPVPPGYVTSAELNGVSCTPPKPCTAVGWYSTAGNPYSQGGALAERWDGTNWALRYPTSDRLDMVSCPTLTSCHAARRSFAQAEGWDGYSWAPESGLSTWEHSGLSCSAATACIAVGRRQQSQVVTTFISAGYVIKARSSAPAADRYSETAGSPQPAAATTGPTVRVAPSVADRTTELLSAAAKD